MPHTKAYYDDFLKRLHITQESTGENRLFLTRKNNSANGRLLDNEDKISNLCKHYGFITIDTGTMPFDEQIYYFKNCRYLIGIHGAGMTNMIFRHGREMNILEIFPPNVIPPHYYWLSIIFGYRYDTIVGEKQNENFLENSFILNPGSLAKKIEGFFNL